SERYQNLCDRKRSNSRVAAMTTRSVSQDQFKLASGATSFRVPREGALVLLRVRRVLRISKMAGATELATRQAVQVVKSCKKPGSGAYICSQPFVEAGMGLHGPHWISLPKGKRGSV